MATVIVIGGVVADVPRTVIPGKLKLYSKGGVESFSFGVRGGALPAGGDPYTGLSVTVTVDGTLRFSGRVVALGEPTIANGVGWVRPYQCLGLRYLGDWAPHTDAITGLDQSAYNVARDNSPQDWVASRSGRQVGQILADVLTMPRNAQMLDSYGIGGYTGLPSAPALPAATLADLAALSWVPPGPCQFGGEKILSAVESFLQTWAPTHCLRVRPDGTLRFPDLRAFTGSTLTFGTDRVMPSGISRDTTECASRVELRGTQVAEMLLFSTSQNAANSAAGLSEAPFAHDGLTVAQAKAAWKPDNWQQPDLQGSGQGEDHGNCTCPTTTSVTVTSSNPLVHWAANYWDYTSTGRQGTIFLAYSTGSSITTYATRATVSNTALAAGGTCTFGLDRALPHLLFDRYVLTGLTGGPSAVWTVYQLPAWAAAKVAPQATVPIIYRSNGSASGSLTSTAAGTVLWSSSGSPPFTSATTGVAVDAVTGLVHFGYPTFLLAGSKPPSDVRALVPVYVASNVVHSPQDASGGVPQYAGTFYSVEGQSRTLVVTVPAWRDPANAASMQTFADNLLDSVKNTVREGSVEYLGLYTPALEMGCALSIAGTGYATGWESAALPVVDCEVSWGVLAGEPVAVRTVMRCSNRMAHFSADQFLHPDRTGETFGWDAGLDLSGGVSLSGYAGIGGLSVADLPSAAGSMPNPGADVPNPGAGLDTSTPDFPNPMG